MLKKFLSLSLALTLVVSVFLGLGSSASAETALQSESSINSFINYLQQESKIDPEAKLTLEKFTSLTVEQKQKFIKYMQDPEVLKNLLNQAASTDELTTTMYNGDVSIVSETAVKDVKSSSLVQDLAYTQYRKATHTFTQYIYGVPITTLKTWVYYSHNGSRILSAYDNGASAKNFNFFVSISDKVGRPWNTSTKAYTTTIWSGYAVYKGAGIRLDKEQQVWGDIYNQSGGHVYNI